MSNKLLPEEYVKYVGLGAEIAVSMALPVIAGYLLDGYFDLLPWLTIVGIVFGMLNFGLLISRIESRLTNKKKDDKK